MLGFVRSSKLISMVAAASFVAAPALAAPQRVVSMNLCTDQLVMMLAKPGQIASVSALAQDPAMSPMAENAKAFPPNFGRAEEIYLMNPDLVIAGQYTSGPATEMLRRLGIRVEVLPPADNVASIRDQITRIGDLLENPSAATALIARFDAGLQARAQQRQGRAALYHANGLTSGRDTLAGEIVALAGYDNIAEEFGVTGYGVLPMELLVMAQPDLLITGAKWPGYSRSEAILDHPALRHLSPRTTEVSDATWVCGTPYILDAIGSLE